VYVSVRPLPSVLGCDSIKRGCERLVEWEGEWNVLDTRERSPAHVGREEERLEGEVREDEEGGTPRVDEP